MMAWGKLITSSRRTVAQAAGCAAFAICTFAVSDTPARSQTVAPAAAETPKKTKQNAKVKPATEEAKAVKKDPAVAQQQIDAGIAALQAGKTDLAVQQLTAALSGGNLPAPLMARAQYQRGLAYRKQAKPALAIADLTQSLYIKNGLSDTDRADAMQNRMAAYRDAGLPDQDDGQAAKIGSAAKAAVPAVTASASPGPIANSTGSLPNAKPSAGLVPKSDETSSDSSVGGFFGKLFGGASAASAPAPVPTPGPSPKPELATSAWSSGTAVKAATVAPAAAAKSGLENNSAALPWQQAAPAKTVALAPAATGRGRYMLQVAQLKTLAEAEAVAARIKEQFAAEFAGRQPVIVAVNQGGFGTLHRVSFGPFADPAEWRPICPKLLTAKHDCQPLAQ